MTSFTIDSDDHVAAVAADLKPEDADHFTSRDELDRLTTQWPAARLVCLWNGLPGVMPVKRFMDRRTALDASGRPSQNESFATRFPATSSVRFARSRRNPWSSIARTETRIPGFTPSLSMRLFEFESSR